jgi:hypothetical protein
MQLLIKLSRILTLRIEYQMLYAVMFSGGGGVMYSSLIMKHILS